jgi:hypothetical protein
MNRPIARRQGGVPRLVHGSETIKWRGRIIESLLLQAGKKLLIIPSCQTALAEPVIHGGGNTPGSMTDKWPPNGWPIMVFQIAV